MRCKEAASRGLPTQIDPIQRGEQIAPRKFDFRAEILVLGRAGILDQKTRETKFGLSCDPAGIVPHPARILPPPPDPLSAASVARRFRPAPTTPHVADHRRDSGRSCAARRRPCKRSAARRPGHHGGDHALHRRRGRPRPASSAPGRAVATEARRSQGDAAQVLMWDPRVELVTGMDSDGRPSAPSPAGTEFVLRAGSHAEI